MHDIYIGIDNGVSGSIGVLGDAVTPMFCKTPIKSQQSYTKKKGSISRIDIIVLDGIIGHFCNRDCLFILERPMVNPGRFRASMSALRALEATLCWLEMNNMAYMYIDSKQWQKSILPKGVKGAPELKKASLDIGSRLYPQFTNEFIKQKDADGVLIAHWAYREKL